MRAEIKIAVDWWVGQLRGPTRQDTGDGNLDVMLQEAIKCMPVITSEQLEAFRDNLTSLLPGYLTPNWYPDDFDYRYARALRALDCDYNPCQLLVAAATPAGIRPSCPPFPVKTCMWISPGRVQVRHGYDGDVVLLGPFNPQPDKP